MNKNKTDFFNKIEKVKNKIANNKNDLFFLNNSKTKFFYVENDYLIYAEVFDDENFYKLTFDERKEEFFRDEELFTYLNDKLSLALLQLFGRKKVFIGEDHCILL